MDFLNFHFPPLGAPAKSGKIENFSFGRFGNFGSECGSYRDSLYDSYRDSLYDLTSRPQTDLTTRALSLKATALRTRNPARVVYLATSQALYYTLSPNPGTPSSHTHTHTHPHTSPA